jgi:hypothetical protein
LLNVWPECRAATDLQVTCVWLSFSQKAQKHGPSSERKPEHHVACWFKLSGQSLEEGEGFPQIPVLGRSGSTVETLPACKVPHQQLSFVDVRDGLSKSADTELVQTGIAPEAAHSAILHLHERKAFPNFALPMIARLLNKKLFLEDWAAAVQELAALRSA